MDLEAVLLSPNLRPTVVPIIGAICGVNSEIMYSEDTQKIVIMLGFNRIAVLPLLHLNLLPFEGQLDKSNYPYAQQFHDEFVVLDAKNDCTRRWNM